MVTILIVVWVGFIACLGLLLSARMMRGSFKKRIQQALNPSDEEVDALLQEQEDEVFTKSLAHRILAPLLKSLGRTTRAKARGAAGQQIKDMLEQAGHPLGMHYAEFIGLKLFMIVFLAGIGIVSSFFAVPLIISLAAIDPSMRMMLSGLWVIIFAYVGFSGPTFWLRKFVNKRIKAIRKAMADVVDLIVLSIEAGLGFDMAVGQAVEKTKGPLADELRRVLDEVRVGKSQSDAFRAMAQRVKMPELTLLIAAIDQAMKMGTGLASALRLQATEIRERRMAFVKEQAGKLPVKMMLPLVFFIFPALFIVILGPAAVKMMKMSAAGQLPGG